MSRKFIPDPPEWARWFAWYPVWIRQEGGYLRVWLEIIERRERGSVDWLIYEYRTVNK